MTPHDPATLRFLLHDVHRCAELLERERYTHLDADALELFLASAEQLAERDLAPLFRPMDRESPRLEDGRVRVHPDMRPLLRAFGEGGWIRAAAPLDADGLQVPAAWSNACLFVFGAANYSATAFPYLSAGNAGLLAAFASPALRDRYLPLLFEGRWQGTMALTEPEAGSSLADLRTTATPLPDGRYRLRGQKIYISCGDHDAADGVLHAMLARIEGAPPGTKGISLFAVPREREEPPGSGTFVPNDVQTAGVYHKMGYGGAPIVHLMVGERDDCIGELIGEPHQGLACMFRMMNEARVAVGLNAASIASAAYRASRAYARTRRQGRPPGERDPAAEPVPIERHADVKRLLLAQKAMVEGALSLLVRCSRWADDIESAPSPQRERAQRLLDLTTPVAKSWPSEAALRAVSDGVQVLGGAGYLADHPLEQLYREARIHPIHEGTTAIHGMDLLGRKLARDQGRALREWLAGVEEDLTAAAGTPGPDALVPGFRQTLARLQAVTAALAQRGLAQGAEAYLADATLYLEAFGLVAVAREWLAMGTAAVRGDRPEAFRRGKLAAMRYFHAYELARAEGLFRQLEKPDPVTLDTDPAWID